MSKTLYGDTLVRLRRTARMGLAAEIQWNLLPPLSFASTEVSVAAALEPAYEVAGDSVDYAVDPDVAFDPTILDGKSARSITPPRTNWAQQLDTPPFRAYPVTGGITFTYGGLEVDDDGTVLRGDGTLIEGLFACGELVGGVFFGGYPGGSGLTSGAVFGRRAGVGAAARAQL